MYTQENVRQAEMELYDQMRSKLPKPQGKQEVLGRLFRRTYASDSTLIDVNEMTARYQRIWLARAPLKRSGYVRIQLLTDIVRYHSIQGSGGHFAIDPTIEATFDDYDDDFPIGRIRGEKTRTPEENMAYIKHLGGYVANLGHADPTISSWHLDEIRQTEPAHTNGLYIIEA